MIQKFLDALDDGTEYDFIANNYHRMKTSDLKTILLEYMYAIHCSSDDEETFRECVRESLIEREVFG